MNHKIYLKLLAILLAFSGIRVLALPEGSTVVSGGGSVGTPEGSTMTFDAPDGSIFNHQTFNVSLGEIVRFNQPSASSRALNRIMSGESSLIDGQIIANGEIYFSTPNGLIFGENASIDVGLLHVIGGHILDTDFLSKNYSYTEILGIIENHGEITSREVILAGKEVTNTGKIVSDLGSVVLAAGQELRITSNDGALSIDLTSQAASGVGVASDLAGQAVFQSGIINAQGAHLSGASIINTGDIDASNLEISRFHDLDATSGEINADSFTLNSAEFQKDVAVTIGLVGEYSNLALSSNGDTEISSGPESSELSLLIQNAHVKVHGGSLNLKTDISPAYDSSSSELLLASDGDLNLLNSDTPFKYDQVLLYGPNLGDELLEPLGDFSAIYSLKGETISINDLQIGLSPPVLKALLDENPTFSAFSYEKLGGVSFNDSDSTDTPSVPVYASPDSSAIPPSDLEFGFFNPAIDDLQNNSLSSGGLSIEQLEVAMKYGLFSTNSYIIEAKKPMPEPSLEDILADSGGSVAVLGGSFDLVKPSVDSSVSSVSETTDSSEAENSEEESAAEEEKTGSKQKDGGSSDNTRIAGISKFLSSLGAAPFAPISHPVMSPEASQILESALSSEIENNLRQYINR
jgi:filamentous hemagglutinin family protein